MTSKKDLKKEIRAKEKLNNDLIMELVEAKRKISRLENELNQKKTE